MKNSRQYWINPLNRLDFFLEQRSTRIKCGILQRKLINKKRNIYQYEFNYEIDYMDNPNAIPCAVELTLDQPCFKAKNIWPSILDRLPQRDNPAYPDYCKACEISEDEEDEFLLLSTLGRKSTGSVIIEAPRREMYSAESLIQFRKNLGISMNDFAKAFSVSSSGLYKIENGKSNGAEVLKRIRLYESNPKLAIEEINYNSAVLNDKIYRKIIAFFEKGGNEKK